jgi:hypothetical protein
MIAIKAKVPASKSAANNPSACLPPENQLLQERLRSESRMVYCLHRVSAAHVPFWSGSLPETGTLFRGIAKEQSRI